jgi:hypothetical protein
LIDVRDVGVVEDVIKVGDVIVGEHVDFVPEP